MDAVIVLVVSAIGTCFCGMDFCTLHTFVSIAISLYQSWINYTNDKTAKR